VKKFCKKILTILFCLSIYTVNSQTGGNSIYEFLNITNSARVAALGGSYLVVNDNDINLVLSNPSLINANMSNSLNLSFIDYYSDITAGYCTYSRAFEKYGNFAATLQFLNYGQFTYADETGETYNNFSAGDYAFNIGWGRALDSSFSIGANLKFIYSSLESYESLGIATDIAAMYHSDKQQLAAAIIIKNIGRQIVSYRPGNKEPLPFKIQFGISKKLAHTPIRFSFLADNLQKWDLTSEQDNKYNINKLTGDTIQEKRFNKFIDKAMRHAVFGAEFTPIKNFSLRIGYNYRRRQELKVDAKHGFTGLSWGLGIKIYYFQIDYGRAIYHLAGAPNNISISTNINNFFNNKNIK